ncbi:MAG TPA: DUF4870 domain-containing protein [Rhodanobacteraceae bacterium]|nr:DUF4870 domain-containing protein [Rhodanobacteraceae bacterium]
MSVPPDSVPPPSPTPPSAPPTPPPAAPPSTELSAVPAEQRQWAMFAHLSAILAAVLTIKLGGLGCFLGPLVIWLIKRDTMPFVDDQGKEATNFNITVAIVFLLMWVFAFMTFGLGLLLTVPLWVLIALAALVFTVIAAIKSNEGVKYRYPFTLRLIK